MTMVCMRQGCVLLSKTFSFREVLHRKSMQSSLRNESANVYVSTKAKSNTRPSMRLMLFSSSICTNHCRGTRPIHNQAVYGRSRFYSTQSAEPLTSSAWQIGKYGGNQVLQMVETLKPTVTKPHDVLIKVYATSVNPIDVRTRGGYGATLLNKARRVKPGDEFPLTLGRDCSGVVVDVGKGVKDVAVDDEVWTSVNAVKAGCHAEYVVCGMEELSRKPKNLTHIEAASIPYVAITNWSAAYAVAKFRPQNALGKRALIFGGSGGIGTFGVQLLNAWGANVTVTCSENAFDLMYRLGAHHAVDYKSPNILQELLKHGKYDFILNAATEAVEDLAIKVIKEKAYAKYVTLITPFLNEIDKKGALLGGLSSSLELFKKSRKFAGAGATFRWAFAQPNGFALKEVAKLAEDGKIKPAIDEVFDYQDLPLAFKKVENGHTRGKVVVNVAGESAKGFERGAPELFQ